MRWFIWMKNMIIMIILIKNHGYNIIIWLYLSHEQWSLWFSLLTMIIVINNISIMKWLRSLWMDNINLSIIIVQCSIHWLWLFMKWLANWSIYSNILNSIDIWYSMIKSVIMNEQSLLIMILIEIWRFPEIGVPPNHPF